MAKLFIHPGFSELEVRIYAEVTKGLYGSPQAPAPKFREGDSMLLGPEGDPDSICILCEKSHHNCRCAQEGF